MILKSIRFFFLISSLLLSTSMFSQSEPRDLAKKFFEDFETAGVSTALENLYSTNDWISRNKDAIIELKSKMEGLNEDYVGKYFGYEEITEKKLSSSYTLISYLVKYDRQPLRFTFQFYKPDSTWKVYSFKYDANLGNELEEAAKIYYLQLTRF